MKISGERFSSIQLDPLKMSHLSQEEEIQPCHPPFYIVL
jgi:hypothetical protein